MHCQSLLPCLALSVMAGAINAAEIRGWDDPTPRSAPPASQVPKTLANDPQGDTFGDGTPQLDLASVDVRVEGSNVRIELVFFTPISPGDSGNDNAVVGEVVLDIDQNPSTGSSGSFLALCPTGPGVGGEFSVNLFSCSQSTSTCDVLDATFNPIGTAGVTIGPMSIDLTIPLSLLGNDDGLIDIQAIVGTIPEPTDCAPDGLVISPPVALPRPPGLDPGDGMGTASAVFGNLIAVGIPNDDGGSGAIVIYRLEGGQPVFETKILVPEGFHATHLGASLALQGNLLLSGAPGTEPVAKGGASPLQAAVFERVNKDWRLKTPVTPANPRQGDEFGAAVAMDDDMLVVGAPGDDEGEASGSGAVYLFDLEGDNSTQMVKRKPPNAQPGNRFGAAVAAKRGKVGVGAPGGALGNAVAGSLTVFQNVFGNLDEIGTVTRGDADDQFGASISIAGDDVMAGAPGSDSQTEDGGAVFIFRAGDNQVTGTGMLTPEDPEPGARFGTALTVSDRDVLVGSPAATAPASSGTGAVYRFRGNAQQEKIEAADGQEDFGASVAASKDRVVVGAPRTAALEGTASIRRSTSRIFADAFELD